MTNVEVYATVDLDHVERQLLQAISLPGFGPIASNALFALRYLKGMLEGTAESPGGPIPDDAPPPPGWERYQFSDEDGCPHESLHVRRIGPRTVTVQQAWEIYRAEHPNHEGMGSP